MKRVLKSIASVAIYRILIAAIAFGSAVFISRTLGPELKGDYSIIMLIPVILFNFCGLGIGLATNYYSAKKKYCLNEILSNALIVVIFISFSVLIFGVFLRFFTKQIFLPNVSDNIIYIALLSVVIQLFSAVPEGMALGLKKFKFTNKILLYLVVVKLGLVAVFYYSISNLLFAYVLAQVLAQIITLALLLKEINKQAVFSFGFFSKKIAKKITNYGIKNQISNILIFMEFKIDLLIIFIMSGSVSVGYYSVAVAVSEISGVFATAINTVLFSEIAGSSNFKIIEKFKKVGIVFSIVSSVVFALAVFFLAQFIVKNLFGSEFLPAVGVLKIMAFVTIFAGIKKVMLSALSAQDLIHLGNPINIFSLLLNVVLNIFLIPKLNIIGAAYSSLISYTFSVFALAIVYAIYSKKKNLEIYSAEPNLSV